MLPWIWDRLPKRTESDPNGKVVCLRRGSLYLINYEYIQEDDTWLPYSPPPQPWQQPRKVPRKIVQALYSPSDKLTALADDGTLWILDCGIWVQITLPDTLPDRDEP
jgi:hypothetical protein